MDEAATLRANLRELARRQPELARRVALSVADDHVRRPVPGATGATELRLHQEWVPLDVPAALLAAEVLPDREELLVFGLGVGDQLEALLGARTGMRVTAWERDPWLLRLALARRDWTSALASGRLRFALGRDFLDFSISGPEDVLLHPLLGEVYALERRELEAAAASDHRTRPVVALGLGGLLVDDVAQALADAGYRVLPLDFARLSLEELRDSLAAAGARFVVHVNYKDGLAEFCREAGVPLLCWEIDPTTDRDVRIAGAVPETHVFTWRKRNVELFRRAGCARAHYLPLAANTERHRPLTESEFGAAERARYAAPVAFVGASMVDRALALRGRFVELHQESLPHVARAACEAQIDELLAVQRRDGSRYVLADLARERFAAFDAALRARGSREDPFQLLAESAAAERRLSWCAALGKHGLHVWGDAGWRRIETFGVTYRGPAGHLRELTRIYNGAAIHVDIGRIYQQDIVTLRVFDVLACGGFVIAERSDDLEDLFDVGREVEAYATVAELLEKVAFYRAHPDAAHAIAERGLAAVRERHTIRARVSSMLASLPAAPLPSPSAPPIATRLP